MRRGCCAPTRAVPIERAPTVEEVIDELRVRLTLVALRAQEDGEDARVCGPSATGLGRRRCSPVDCRNGRGPALDQTRQRLAPPLLQCAKRSCLDSATEAHPLDEKRNFTPHEKRERIARVMQMVRRDLAARHRGSGRQDRRRGALTAARPPALTPREHVRWIAARGQKPATGTEGAAPSSPRGLPCTA